MNPYEVLGVPVDATDAEIKTAYNALIEKFHPAENALEIQQINAAYEILSDAEKKQQFQDQEYLTVDDLTDEADAREAYRQEYIRKKNEQVRLAREHKIASDRKTFKIFWVLNIPILLFAIVLVTDEFLPGVVYKEVATKGWQGRVGESRRSQGVLVSFVETKNFAFAVPHAVHLNYDYYDKPDVFTLEVSPVFKIINTVSVTVANKRYQFKALGTIFSRDRPVHYFLLVSSIITALLWRYSTISYWLCFLPVLLLGFVFLALWSNPV